MAKEYYAIMGEDECVSVYSGYIGTRTLAVFPKQLAIEVRAYYGVERFKLVNRKEIELPVYKFDTQKEWDDF